MVNTIPTPKAPLAPLGGMTFGEALSLALETSGMSQEEIAWGMNWTKSYASRVLNPTENYWPSTATIPDLCAVLRNEVLILWMSARYAYHVDGLCSGVSGFVPSTVPPDAVTLRVMRMAQELGDLSRETANAMADRSITVPEVRRIRREAFQMMGQGVHLLRDLGTIEARA